jgi:ABC-2 type transport system permease protein
LGLLGNVGGAAIAATPVLVAAVLTNGDRAAATVLLACAAVYGFALAWAGVRIAARAAQEKLPEMCQAAIRSRL